MFTQVGMQSDVNALSHYLQNHCNMRINSPSTTVMRKNTLSRKAERHVVPTDSHGPH